MKPPRAHGGPPRRTDTLHQRSCAAAKPPQPPASSHTSPDSARRWRPKFSAAVCQDWGRARAGKRARGAPPISAAEQQQEAGCNCSPRNAARALRARHPRLGNLPCAFHGAGVTEASLCLPACLPLTLGGHRLPSPHAPQSQIVPAAPGAAAFQQTLTTPRLCCLYFLQGDPLPNSLLPQLNLHRLAGGVPTP